VAIAVYLSWDATVQLQEFDDTVAASAAFCAEAVADPATLAPPIYSWPRQEESIDATLDAMQAFIDRWDAMGELAPAGIQDGVLSIADRGRELRDLVEVARQIDDEQNTSLMQQTIEQSGVDAWVSTYCPDAP